MTAAVAILSAGAVLVGRAEPRSDALSGEPPRPEDEQAPVVVPFEFPGEQIILQAFIGGQGPFNFIVDTAVNPSVVDLTAALEAGLLVDTTQPLAANGVGSRRTLVYPTEIADLQIGGRTQPSFSAVAMDLRAMSERLERPLHGALGYSFLSTRAIRIDYPGRTLSIFDGPAPLEQEGGAQFSLELDGTYVRLDPIFVNGRPMSVNLDTGASPALTISSSVIERLGLGELRATAEPGLVRGAQGTAEVFRATADSLRAGSLLQRRPEIAFASWVQNADGILGNGFLREYVLTVDYVGARVGIGSSAP